jgi:hypothetical protein
VKHYINFTAIGWNDWIIKPDGFMANYCTGNCHPSAHPPVSTTYRHVSEGVCNMHTHTQLIVADYNSAGVKADTRMLPCCAPTVPMNGLTVLYLFNGAFYKQTLENIIVTACDCS